eukprot:1158419-Pelagomonas_calceolata.AAC.6
MPVKGHPPCLPPALPRSQGSCEHAPEGWGCTARSHLAATGPWRSAGLLSGSGTLWRGCPTSAASPPPCCWNELRTRAAGWRPAPAGTARAPVCCPARPSAAA